MNSPPSGITLRISSAAAWLTYRRIRAHAIVLALCLWGVCAVDYATPGIFDRAGNVKFQDFLQFPVSAHLIATGRSAELYDDHVLASEIRAIVGSDTTVYLQYFYGPQVALPFVPLLRLSFLSQAATWATLSLLIYFGCVFLVGRSCTELSTHSVFIALCAAAYPPVFHFFVRGQVSAAVLACFTGAYFAFRAEHDWLAGFALGLLAFKPQFLVAIPIVLLLAGAWRAFAGLFLSAGAQMAVTYLHFGPVVMRLYLNTLLHSASRPATAELTFSPIQMHSLRTFWALLIPWPPAVWGLYALSSLAVIGISAAIWKSPSSLALRFSALVLAAVLINPHIYIYDLLALAPALLLLTAWTLSHTANPFTPALRLLLYLAFVLPLFGPLSRWTHLQLSVPVFAAILCILWRLTNFGPVAALDSRP